MSDTGREELAEDRTDLAEDRTVLANERTFAGWMRTGLAAVGVGLGFHALFGRTEPSWVPKLVATLFVLVGVAIFLLAQRTGCAVLDRLSAHRVRPAKGMNLRLIAWLFTLGSVMLIAGFWLMKFEGAT